MPENRPKNKNSNKNNKKNEKQDTLTNIDNENLVSQTNDTQIEDIESELSHSEDDSENEVKPGDCNLNNFLSLISKSYDKKVSCNFCEKHFSSKAELKGHENIHTLSTEDIDDTSLSKDDILFEQ